MKNKYRILVAMMILPYVITGIFLIFLPDQIPMHYNAQGEIDRIGSKYEMLLLPVLFSLIGGIMYPLARQQRKKQEYRNETVLIWTGIFMQLLFTVTDLIFLWADLNYGGSAKQPADVSKLTAIGIGILMMLLGNAMPKAARNSLFGLRTVWSMKNDRVWQKSQRFSGYIVVLCGFLMVLAGIFFSRGVLMSVSLSLALVCVLICTAASYRYYKADLQNGAD